MKVLPIQAENLINGLKHCQFSSKLVLPLSQRLQVCPKTLAQELIILVEQLPCKNPDPSMKLNFLNKALLECENISDKLKERLASELGISISQIQP